MPGIIGGAALRGEFLANPSGRGGRIRTGDHLNPIQVRYQTALHPGLAFDIVSQIVSESNERLAFKIYLKILRF